MAVDLATDQKVFVQIAPQPDQCPQLVVDQVGNYDQLPRQSRLKGGGVRLFIIKQIRFITPGLKFANAIDDIGFTQAALNLQLPVF